MTVSLLESLSKTQLASWKKLWKESSTAHFCNSPDWFLALQEAYPGREYRIVWGEEAGSLQFVLPLFRQKIGLFTYFTHGGFDFSYDTPALGTADDLESRQAIAAALRTCGVVLLTNVNEATHTLLAPGGTKEAYLLTTRTYSLDFAQAQDILSDQAGKKLLSRAYRHLDDCKLTVHRGDDKDAFALVLEVDAKSSKREQGIAAFDDPATVQFYAALATYMPESMRLHLLWKDGTVIAYEIGFVVRSRYFGSQLAYRASERKNAPGKMLIWKLLRHLQSQGYLGICFGTGDNQIKRQLSSSSSMYGTVLVAQSETMIKLFKICIGLREWIYEWMSANSGLYTFYRKFKQLVARSSYV